MIKTKPSPFEEKISPLLPSAYNLARWLTRNEVDAEDVLQESVIKAFRFFEAAESENLKPWLLQIVRNTTFTWLRKNRNLVLYEDDELEKLNEPLESAPETPETILLNSSNANEIRSALEALTPEFREILILREFEDLSYSEIAQVIGAKEGTVMSRISRAKEKLKIQLIKNKNGEKS